MENSETQREKPCRYKTTHSLRWRQFFLEDFIMGSLNLNLGAPRFSGYLQNRRSCGLLFLFGAPVVTDNGG